MPDTLSLRLRLKRGASFTLDVEERIPLTGITAVTGPSGSGKTTLLRALAGLDAETSGTRAVRFAGAVWDDEAHSIPPEDRRVGMVFQEPALFPHLSVARNIGYGARRRRVVATDAIIEALDLAPMMAREVTSLSGGEARRVALARALASDPAIMLLDETMSGLDAQRKADFLPYLARAVTAARVPTIYVTHAADEIATLADRVLALRDGRSAGWLTPPMRLLAKVVGTAAGGGMTLRVEGASEADIDGTLTVPVRAPAGERVGLGLLPDALHVSVDYPGEGSAMVVLPATLETSEDRADRAVLKVLGQALVPPTQMRLPRGHQRLWLSILRVFPRPELGDSRG